MEKIDDKIMTLMAIALGLTFIYVPLFDFLQSHSRQRELSETEKADFKTITGNQDQVAMTDVVNRLMTRADIARIEVTKGEHNYPDFQITRGKNSQPGEISRHVNHNEKGLLVYIGYSTSLDTPISFEREIKEGIKSMGSAIGGFCLVLVGFLNLAGALKSEQRSDERRPPMPPLPPPEAKEIDPEPKATEPIRYGELKLVKDKDEKVRPAS